MTPAQLDAHRDRPCNHNGAQCASWIMVRVATCEAIAEVYSVAHVARFDPAKVASVRPCRYLPTLNTHR